VNLGKVNPVMLAAAGNAEGVTVTRRGESIIVQGGAWRMVVSADGRADVESARAGVMWGGARFDITSDDGRAGLVNAIRRSVAVQSVAAAARAAGLRVQSTGPTTARISRVQGVR
jgi:hypothetical protein